MQTGANPPQPTPATEVADASGASFIDVPHTMTRRTIARRLTEAKQHVPHFYLKAACRMDAMLAMRTERNATGAAKLSVNDLIVKAVALAMQAVPDSNVSWGDDALRRHTDVDVSVAVATVRGLVTPIVRGANFKPVELLAEELRELTSRARVGRLKKEEYQGGTVSVSNLGMYGIDEFSAIVNPPQSAIFAIGAAVQRPFVENGAVIVTTMMNVTASIDHRAVDGATGAQLLSAFRRILESPTELFV